MCINQIEKFDVSHTEVGIGYKWVTKWKGKYYSSNFPAGWSYKPKIWNRAKDNGQSQKDVGFHIYDLYTDAEASGYKSPMDSYWKPKSSVATKRSGAESVLLQVRYKDFHTGYGDGLDSGVAARMIVAKQMMIIKEVK